MKKRKRLAGVLLICVMGISVISGCSGEKTVNDTTEQTQDAGTGYEETEISLPEEAGVPVTLSQLSDGSLKGVGSSGQILVSGDNGETWETLSSDTQAVGEKSVKMACISDRGALFLALGEASEGENQEKPYTYCFITQEGEQRELEPEIPGDDILIPYSFLSETEVLAWYKGDASFYRISMEDGASEKLFEAATGYQTCCVTGQEIVTDADNSLMIYDMERGITRVIKAEGTVGKKLSAGREEGTFYLLNSQGIYLCRTEDGKGEPVVKGNTMAIGNPSYSAVSFLQQKNGEFLVLYRKEEDQTYHLMKYSSESEKENTASQPAHSAQADEAIGEKQTETEEIRREKTEGEEGDFTVYTLNDSELLRLAIAAFQSKNPDLEISLEVGMTGEDAVTVSDAIKMLNTELISGEGPDVIFLDELPLEDYMEKGVLEDISSVLDEFDGSQLYENIVRAYDQNGKIYAVPTRFEIPLLVSKGEDVGDPGSLEDIANAVEAYASEEDNIRVVGPITPKQMIESFYDAYISEYSNQEEIDEKGLSDFFTQVLRIFKVRKERVLAEEEIRGEALDQESLGDEFSGPYSGVGQWLAGGLRVSINHIGDMNAYSVLTSLAKEDGEIVLQGIGNVFDPMRIVGISAGSDARDTGKQFLKLLLSKEIQENSSFRETSGFPVNQEALEKFGRTSQQKNGELTGKSLFPAEFVLTGEDPDSFEHKELSVYWPSDEEYQKLRDLFGNLQVAYTLDPEVKTAVIEQGSKCLEGQISPEEAARAAIQEVRLQRME